jgi:hypothetical protein
MRRLPPNKIEQSLSGLLNLIPQETDELLQRVDQPLEEAVDPESGRKYLLCDYNRDGDSYRYCSLLSVYWQFLSVSLLFRRTYLLNLYT